MKLLYKFIGTEEDRKKFVDPEPEIGREYTEEEFDILIEKNPFMTENYMITKFFTGFYKEIKEETVNHLTPIMRLEIVKSFPQWFDNLKMVENYINTGKHDDRVVIDGRSLITGEDVRFTMNRDRTE